MIRDEWIQGMMEAATDLILPAFRNDVDHMEIKIVPEYGYASITASNDREVVTASRFDVFPEIKIERKQHEQSKQNKGAKYSA